MIKMYSQTTPIKQTNSSKKPNNTDIAFDNPKNGDFFFCNTNDKEQMLFTGNNSSRINVL